MHLNAIFIINLESDVDKKQHMMNLIKKYQLQNICTTPIQFFPAIDKRGQATPLGFKGNGGAYGCTLSHIHILRHIDAQQHVLITEDDLHIHKHFWKLWGCPQPPADYNICYLGATQICWDSIVPPENGWYTARRTLGTTAYVVRDSSVAEDIVALWEEDGCRLPIDELLVKYQEICGKCYVRYPNLFIQDVECSSTRGDKTWTMENIHKRLRWDLEAYDDVPTATTLVSDGDDGGGSIQ